MSRVTNPSSDYHPDGNRSRAVRVTLGLVVALVAGCTGDQYVTWFKGTPGTTSVDAGINFCPHIVLASVAPLQVGVGGGGILHAEAADPDGNKLNFLWSSTAGSTIAHASDADATYLCTTVGEQTLTVTVSDGQGCTDQYSAQVKCVSLGDGSAENRN